ncbi:MAG: class I SAM-dependent methyltransferase [Thermoleophilia bacterium]
MDTETVNAWDHAGLYGELARWWPLVSPPHEYVGEAAYAEGLLASHTPAVRTVLELGSGGGCMAHHLSRRFAMTLVDVSPGMLAASRRLNPGVAHLPGDMRTVRLGRRFDAVFIHDAIDYMRTPQDLRAALRTARAHLAPGGLVLVMPDHTAERFVPDTDHGGVDGDGGEGVRYLVWNWDPDPSDQECRMEFAFVVREAGGAVRVVLDRHVLGLFPRDEWMRALGDAGFDARSLIEETDEPRVPREVFMGVAR